ncbi:MAG: dihydroneopterin aldolase [Candidatus Lokiarchaeota archaeon]|nr:dihydroneopterin aldolase [Candidatus Lokiarchaeota archaeon]
MDEKIFFSENLSNRERACFEAGIKLGALYHILCGIPISSDVTVISSIERGIEAAISCQPYVKRVKISLNLEKIKGRKENEFDYDEVSGKIINAHLILQYENVILEAKIDWIEDMDYPLMYIEKIYDSNR